DAPLQRLAHAARTIVLLVGATARPPQEMSGTADPEETLQRAHGSGTTHGGHREAPERDWLVPPAREAPAPRCCLSALHRAGHRVARAARSAAGSAARVLARGAARPRRDSPPGSDGCR